MNPNTFNKITRLLNGESFITKEPGNSMLPLYKSNEEHLLKDLLGDTALKPDNGARTKILFAGVEACSNIK